MTEKEIAEVIGKDRVLAGHAIVCDNVNYLMTGQQDFISITKAGYLIEYEIKLTRSDFFNDAKKDRISRNEKNKRLNFPVINQLYYVVPIGLVDIHEVPEWAGLMYVTDKKVLYSKKTAPFLHKNKNELLPILSKVITLYQQRKFLGCCLLTHKNKKNRDAYRDILNKNYETDN